MIALCGWAADHLSNRRTPLLFGLLALAGATILLQLGRNIGVLILGRVLQGFSAAVVWVVGLAMLADTIPKSELGQAMGYVLIAMSLGVFLGPLLGGVVFERAGYNAVYAMAYVLIALDVVLRILLVEKKPVQQIDIAHTDLEPAASIRSGNTGQTGSSPQRVAAPWM